MFQSGVSRQDGVVWFNNSCRNLWSWVHGIFELGFLAVVNAQPLHQQRGESRTGATTKAVEDEEALKTGALVGKFSNAVEYKVDDFLSNGVVTTGVIVGRVLLSTDQLFRMEELAICSGSDFI